MAEPQGSLLHQQGLTVLGLLTGFMMTTLVLILGSPQAFHSSLGPLSGGQSFEILVVYVATEAAVGIFGIMAFLEVGSGWARRRSRLDQFGYVCFLIALFGFTGALPLLLAPFSKYGAVAVLALAGVLFSAYLAAGGMRASRPD